MIGCSWIAGAEPGTFNAVCAGTGSMLVFAIAVAAIGTASWLLHTRERTSEAVRVACRKHPDAGTVPDHYKGDSILRCSSCESILFREFGE